ncbi:unnamed protein product [Symbiodinium necroappetens]|uniref:Uncharacterized protein n=1 Tax=Symbiodinium necroappetens TaxID=1628268 RepID=A0A812X174_9DINO|nr:unnamed protein product [Symbiodinium microadriaticum]CAE7680986.1 unnamed protein product [Symbiodinium sp. KB8]CAE7702099.1 unnamed protein product [Symbiodinium necroappetens]|mmetsp:Transcript_134195/g.189602  ORF Transcript_134195/g.189602 Transcript_134195/m.189602 type:complete len:125 (-) Transcript_134195:172-546(-)|eukprot:s1603_g17.t1
MDLSADGWAQEPDSLERRISRTEAQAQRLKEEVATVLRGLAALKEQVKSADDLAGDPGSEDMRREIDEVLKRQTEVLEEMVKSTESFPRRWAQFELNTSQRKSLILSIKARKAHDRVLRGDGSP